MTNDSTRLTEITLTGPTNYNESYPPKNARKGYVAKITGRASGAKKYEREFFGESVTLLEGDEGLYERQIGDKKGGYTRYYHVMLFHPEHGLILSVDCEDEVPKLAKLLDDGRKIEDIVEVVDLRPSQKFEGRMIFDVAVRTATQAKAAAKSATIESATETCWDVLRLLPEKEAKKVLTELRKRVSPPKPKAEAAPCAGAGE
jgi:hypothetical protein